MSLEQKPVKKGALSTPGRGASILSAGYQAPNHLSVGLERDRLTLVDFFH